MDLEVIREAAIATGKSVGVILGEIEAEERRETGQEPEPVEPVEAAEEEEQVSYLVVGKGEGEPGDVVRIEILGKTHLPVNGFGLAVGCHQSLSLVGSNVSAELSEMLGMENPQKIVKEHDGASWKDTFLQVGVIFFSKLWENIDAPIPEGKPPAVRRAIIDLQLSTLIPIFVFELLIPDQAKVGHRYELNAEYRYGHQFKYANGRTRWIGYPTEYSTSREVSGLPIRPSFVSGWIDVI